MSRSGPTSRDRAIVRYHLQGYNPTSILGFLRRGWKTKSRGTVYEQIEIFEQRVREKGLEASAREYGVIEEVERVRETNSFLREHKKVTAQDMLEGGRISDSLQKLGVSPDELSPFVNEVHKRATEGGRDARSIIKDCSTLNELEARYGKPFEEQTRDYDSKVKKIPELEQKADGLRKGINDSEKRYAELLAKFNTDEKSLQDFETTRNFLSDYGLTLRDLDSEAKVLQQLSKDEALHLVRKLKQVGDVEEKLRSQHADLDRLKLDREEEENKRDSARKELKQMDPELKEARSIRGIGLLPSQFESLRNMVVKLSSVHGISAAQSFELLGNEVRASYDLLLGFKPALEEKKAEIAARESEVEKQKEKLREMETRRGVIGKELDAYNRVTAKGVSAEMILRWERTLGGAALERGVVERELKEHRDLRRLSGQLEKKINEMELRKNGLTDAMAASKTLEDARLRAVKMITDTADALNETVSSATTRLDASVAPLNVAVAGVQSALKELAHAEKVGEMIGRLTGMMTLYKLIRNEEGLTRDEVLLVVRDLVAAFREWMKKSPVKDQLDSEAAQFQGAVEKAMRY